MLIDVEKMRLLRTDTTEMKYKLLKTNIERFFRDYIYYFNVYEGKELIIDSGYLPFHYLDRDVLPRIVSLLEKELGYDIIMMKTTNVNKQGYIKGDLINIRLFDRQIATPKEVDDYFNLKIFQPLYSTFHQYDNIDGEAQNDSSYLKCQEGFLLDTNLK